MGEAWQEIELVEPQSRWHEVAGRRIQGWFLPGLGHGAGRGLAAGGRDPRRPGTRSTAGRSIWEWQCLVGARASASTPATRAARRATAQDFNDANFGDWGTGPMRDVMAGVDALVADGLADPERLGRDRRFVRRLPDQLDRRPRPALPGRDDLPLRQRHDHAVPDRRHRRAAVGPPIEFGANPWEDPDLYYREISPLTYAPNIRTPLLIQHSERDLRTPIGQAEAAVHRPALAEAAGPPDARARRDPRADPVRHARSAASRTCAIIRRLVPPLPRRREAAPAARPEAARLTAPRSTRHAVRVMRERAIRARVPRDEPVIVGQPRTSSPAGMPVSHDAAARSTSSSHARRGSRAAASR